MKTLTLISRWIANVVSVLGAIGIIIMMIHIACDVLARLFLGSPLIGTNEIVSRYYMITVTFLPLAWVEYRNGMISVELFDAHLPKPVLLLSDLMVGLVSVGALAILAWTSWHEALEAFSKDVFVMAIGTRIPVWPTYFFIPIGCFLACVMVAIRVLVTAMTGRSVYSQIQDAH